MNPALHAEGYADIVDEAMPLIAAHNVGGEPQLERCSLGVRAHRAAWNGVKANFLSPPA